MQNREMLAEKEITGVAESDPDYLHESSLVFNQGKLISATGHAISLFQDLAFALKFRPKIIKGTGWGDRLENGSWAGMSSQLLSLEADICISQATLTMDRAEIFTFLQPTFRGTFLAHFRQPSVSSSFRHDLFSRPFDTETWLVILLTFLTFAVCFKVFSWIWTRMKNSSFDGQDGLEITVSDLIFWTLGYISQQGCDSLPKTYNNVNSVQILIISAILTSTLLFGAYQAVLLSIFSSQPVPISDFGQLKDALRIVGDKGIPFIYEIVQDANKKGGKKKIWSTSSSASTVASSSSSSLQLLDISEAVDAVLGKEIAFLTIDSFFASFVGKNRTEKEFCQNIYTIRALKTVRWAGMFVRRNWEHKEIFGKNIIKIMERGLNGRYEKLSYKESLPQCDVQNTHTDSSEKVHEIQLEDVAVAVFLNGFGMSLAIIIFALEKIVNAFQIKRKLKLGWGFYHN